MQHTTKKTSINHEMISSFYFHKKRRLLASNLRSQEKATKNQIMFVTCEWEKKRRAELENLTAAAATHNNNRLFLLSIQVNYSTNCNFNLHFRKYIVLNFKPYLSLIVISPVQYLNFDKSRQIFTNSHTSYCMYNLSLKLGELLLLEFTEFLSVFILVKPVVWEDEWRPT